MSEEVLRLVDSMHRDKGVDKEIIYTAVEESLAAAVKKRFKSEGDVIVKVDRETGDIAASEDGEPILNDGMPLKLEDMGRIAARSAYQLMNQRIREAERDVIFNDFEARLDTLVTGTVQRFERGNMIVNLGRTEGILPRSEQVFNETYRAGDRVRAYVLNVKKKGQKVVILLSRTHPNVVRELFALEIPEVSDRIVEIKNTVREPGFRTKVAVVSNDARVDPQGACIGVRGSRIRSIVEELGGERIDIVPWNESSEIYIKKALSPAEITAVDMDRDSGRARVIVPEDQLSLAIGKRGQNVRLAARLTGWHLDILTEEEAKREKDAMKAEMERLPEVIEGLDDATVGTMTLSGFSTLHAIAKKGAEALLEVKGMDEAKATELHAYAVKRVAEIDQEKAQRIAEERKRVREEAEARVAAEAAEAAAVAAAAAAGETSAEGAAEGEKAAGAGAEGEGVAEEGESVEEGPGDAAAEGDVPNETGEAGEADKTDEAGEAGEADKTDEAGEADKTDEAGEAGEADKTDETGEAGEADQTDEADEDGPGSEEGDRGDQQA